MLSVVDMCRHHKDVKLEFELDIDKWNTMDPDIQDIISDGSWESIKYLKSDGITLSDEISELPNDSGGIYVFVLQHMQIWLISWWLGKCDEERINQALKGIQDKE